MKAVVAAFNQEKALVGAFSVIMNLRMELFQALVNSQSSQRRGGLLSALLLSALELEHNFAAQIWTLGQQSPCQVDVFLQS